MISWRSTAFDCAVLLLVVAIPASLYAGSLGFYSDDWAALASLVQWPDQSFAGLYAHLAQQPNLATRPVQIALLILQYQWFGLQPFWGHVINHLVLWLGGGVVYIAIRHLIGSRLSALSIICIYLCLPHFSTTRMWFANFQAHWSLMFFGIYLLSITQVAAARTRPRIVLWQAIAVVAMSLSVLAYEFFLPLLVAFPILLWLVRARSTPPAAVGLRMLAGTAVAVVVAAILVGFKLSAAAGSIPSVTEGWLSKALHLYLDAIRASYWRLGLRLPVDIVDLLQRPGQHAGAVVAGMLVALVVGSALWGINRLDRSEGFGFQRASALWAAAALAAAIFFAGYFVLLQSFYASLVIPTGIGNRVNIAGALGVAAILLVIVAAIDVWRRGKGRPLLLVLIAIVCGGGTYVLSELGLLWAQASKVQEALYADLTRALPDLPEGSTVLLYGSCPYHGPGPVFTSSWDLSARLQLTTGRGVLADVITSDSSFGPQGVTQVEYGVGTTTGYGNLFVYSHQDSSVSRLASEADAVAYFAAHPIEYSSPCTFGDGGGEPLF